MSTLSKLIGRPKTVDEMQRLNWALSAIARSSQALIHRESFEALAQTVCDAIASEEAYALAWVGLCGNTPDKLVEFTAWSGRAQGYMKDLRLSWSADRPEGRGPFGESMRTGLPHLMWDSEIDAKFTRWRESARHFGLRSSVTVPIHQGREIVGALVVYGDRPDAFGPNELALFGQLADELGYARGVAADAQRLAELCNACEMAEERYNHTINLVPVGIAQLSSDGTFTVVNEALCRLFDVPRAALIGRRLAEFSVEPEMSEPAARGDPLGAAFAELMAKGSVQDIDWPCRTPAGRLLWIALSLQAVPDHGERIVLAVLKDVTEQRAREAKIADAQKLEAIGLLASGIAHDFNNLMTAISGMALVLEEQLADNGDAAAVAGRIVKTSARGRALSQRIMQLVRPSSGRRTPVDLSGFVAAEYDFLATMLPPDISLQHKLAAGGVTVHADADEIGRLLQNLVLNARDAMRDRSGTITVSVDRVAPFSPELIRKPMAGSLDPSRAYARLRVVDQGQGIASDVLANVFKPFFSTKTGGQGHGLGLTIVQSAVVGHGGACIIDSQQGKGTRFSIYLPAMPDEA